MNEEWSINATEFLDKIIKHLPGIVFWKDTNSIYRGCNEMLAKVFGVNIREEVIGKNDHDLGWGVQDVERICKDDQDVIRSKIPKHNIYERLPLANGNFMDVLTNKEPLFDDNNNVIGVFGIATDVTQLRETQKQLEAARKQAEEIRQSVMVLAGSVGHDLRTPLASLSMLFDGLRNRLVKDFQLDALEPYTKTFELAKNILTDINHFIDQTLDNLKQVSRGTTKDSQFSSCNINICVARAINSYPFENNERDLIVYTHQKSFTFLGNPIYFYRIMCNLFKNSLYQIQQTGKGKIIIETEVGDEWNILRYKDTAGDVTLEKIATIFTAFATTKTNGSGIGLAFCELAMQHMGGDISCELVDGDCIQFTLRFPIYNPP
jgi:PAS domain S-box-containing protein